MVLPIYQSNTPQSFSMLQTNWAQQLNPVIAQPLNNGSLLQSVSLNIGTNLIPHKLSRALIGWFLTRLRGQAVIYDTQDSNPNPTLTLSLNSNAKVVVDIFVF